MPPSPLPSTGRWKTFVRGSLGSEVADRGAAGELVGAQERGVAHLRRVANALTHELVEGHARHPLRDQREHDVAAVAVRESLAGGELRLVPGERGKVLLGGRQLVHRHRHQVIAEVEVALLVEIVANAGAVREQLLDRDVVGDQR